MSWTTPTSAASTGSRRTHDRPPPAAGPAEPALRWRPGTVDPLTLGALPGRLLPAVVTVRGWTVVVGEPIAVLRDPALLNGLGERCGWRGPPWRQGPPFLGGAVGYLTEDIAAPWLHLAADPRPARRGVRGLWMAVHDTAVCIPPDGRGAWLVAADLPGWSNRPRAQRLAELDTLVDAARAHPRPRPPTPADPVTPVLSLDARAHRAAVRHIHTWIAAGDLYQLNLTLQIGVPWSADGAALADRLWRENPDAAHAAWLRTGAADIVSVSPETFLRTDGDRIAVRPIKGTRARADDPAADTGRANALERSQKDRAEHVMIVDLERNDLGRVCRTGSIRVPELMAIERHPTVWHLTSTVTGRLQPDAGLGDVLAALFPCGSVTGAPKRMAVARSREVEPIRRGVYCGAIGVVSRGLVDLSVAIRTAVLHDGIARYGTGGGIVADSDERAEFSEAMDKAAAFLRAVGAPRPAALTPAARPR